MTGSTNRSAWGALLLLVITALAASGCQSSVRHRERPYADGEPEIVDVSTPVPRELSKTILPRYVIESPDLLVIDAIHIVPKQPYRMRPFDVLALQVQGTPPEA